MVNVGDLTKTGEQIRKAVDAITGKKYCSSCHSYQVVEGGKEVLISNGRHKRWKCVNCLKRISARKYESKSKGEVK
jgi:transposase-like protein